MPVVPRFPHREEWRSSLLVDVCFVLLLLHAFFRGRIRPRAKLAESFREEAAALLSPGDRQGSTLSRMSASHESFEAALSETSWWRSSSQRQSLKEIASPTSNLSRMHSQAAFSSTQVKQTGDLPVDVVHPRLSACGQEDATGQSLLEDVREHKSVSNDACAIPVVPPRHLTPAKEQERTASGIEADERGRAPSKTSFPSRASIMQKAVAEVFAAEDQRRAAALASRISSRAISRQEGSSDMTRFSQRADVTHAAAEQLRKMGASALPNGREAHPEVSREISGGPARGAGTGVAHWGGLSRPFQGTPRGFERMADLLAFAIVPLHRGYL